MYPKFLVEMINECKISKKEIIHFFKEPNMDYNKQ